MCIGCAGRVEEWRRVYRGGFTLPSSARVEARVIVRAKGGERLIGEGS